MRIFQGSLPVAALTTVVGLTGSACNRLPESYTALVYAQVPGDVAYPASPVRVSFKRGALRVDFRDGSPLPGYAMAWQNQSEVLVAMPGREVVHRWRASGIALQYGLPPFDELLVLPFNRSKWMKGARSLGKTTTSDGKQCELWVKLSATYIHRIWVHVDWGIPLQLETLHHTGGVAARYELREVRPFAVIGDERFVAP